MRPLDQVYALDCLSAAVASILEVPLSEVPLFHDNCEDGRTIGQHERLQRWLYKRGLTFIDFPIRTSSALTCRTPWEPLRATWCIITIKYGPRKYHAVVGRACRRGIRIVHDPDKSVAPGHKKGKPTSVGFIVPCQVQRWTRR